MGDERQPLNYERPVHQSGSLCFQKCVYSKRDPAQIGTPQRRQIGTPKSLFSDSNRNTTNAYKCVK